MTSESDHRAEAERLLGDALNPSTGAPYGDTPQSRIGNTLLAALAHATLALGTIRAPATVPAAAGSRVWWLDDGHESAAPPDIRIDHGCAMAAGVQRFRDDNPQSGDARCVWTAIEDDDPDALELHADGRATGIVVRPIRPRGIA